MYGYHLSVRTLRSASILFGIFLMLAACSSSSNLLAPSLPARSPTSTFDRNISRRSERLSRGLHNYFVIILPGSAYAEGIDNRSWVNGTVGVPGVTIGHAILWHDKTATDLGTLGG